MPCDRFRNTVQTSYRNIPMNKFVRLYPICPRRRCPQMQAADAGEVGAGDEAGAGAAFVGVNGESVSFCGAGYDPAVTSFFLIYETARPRSFWLLPTPPLR